MMARAFGIHVYRTNEYSKSLIDDAVKSLGFSERVSEFIEKQSNLTRRVLKDE